VNLADRYVDLLIRHLTGYRLDNCAGHPDEVRENGGDWPERAVSMIGMVRMRQLANAVSQVIDAGVPGDLMECGVWRGGACILMRALLDVHDGGGRDVWVADSFAGLPPPDSEQWPLDEGDTLWSHRELMVSQSTVEANFAEYGWLDERVRFLPGFFSLSLPGPVEQLALLRLDGDLYGSIMVCLDTLYDKVSPGGIVIVDDYGPDSRTRGATDDYRARHGIDSPIHMTADMNTGWWVKP
jgi:O-methyltransferase